jgi:hypothetical protein
MSVPVVHFRLDQAVTAATPANPVPVRIERRRDQAYRQCSADGVGVPAASGSRYSGKVALFQDFAVVEFVAGDNKSQSADGDLILVGDSSA